MKDKLRKNAYTMDFGIILNHKKFTYYIYLKRNKHIYSMKFLLAITSGILNYEAILQILQFFP